MFKHILIKFLPTTLALQSGARAFSSNLKPFNKINDPLITKELLTFPNQAVVWSILEGPNKGKVLELPGKKSVILIENSSDPFVFIAGSPDEKALNAVSKVCINNPYLYCAPIYHDWFINQGWEINLRVQLQYSSRIIKSVEKGLTIKPINTLEFFKNCYEFDSISEKYGSAENFLKYGQGYALCKQEQIISEVYSDYYGNGYIEIGIVTHPNYRKLGAGSQIASYFAEKCLEQKKIPIWSCNANNIASLKTALSIGFYIEKYYVQMVQSEKIKNKEKVNTPTSEDIDFNPIEKGTSFSEIESDTCLLLGEIV